MIHHFVVHSSAVSLVAYVFPSLPPSRFFQFPHSLSPPVLTLAGFPWPASPSHRLFRVNAPPPPQGPPPPRRPAPPRHSRSFSAGAATSERAPTLATSVLLPPTQPESQSASPAHTCAAAPAQPPAPIVSNCIAPITQPQQISSSTPQPAEVQPALTQEAQAHPTSATTAAGKPASERLDTASAPVLVPVAPPGATAIAMAVEAGEAAGQVVMAEAGMAAEGPPADGTASVSTSTALPPPPSQPPTLAPTLTPLPTSASSACPASCATTAASTGPISTLTTLSTPSNNTTAADVAATPAPATVDVTPKTSSTAPTPAVTGLPGTAAAASSGIGPPSDSALLVPQCTPTLFSAPSAALPPDTAVLLPAPLAPPAPFGLPQPPAAATPPPVPSVHAPPAPPAAAPTLPPVAAAITPPRLFYDAGVQTEAGLSCHASSSASGGLGESTLDPSAVPLPSRASSSSSDSSTSLSPSPRPWAVVPAVSSDGIRGIGFDSGSSSLVDGLTSPLGEASARATPASPPPTPPLCTTPPSSPPPAAPNPPSDPSAHAPVHFLPLPGPLRTRHPCSRLPLPLRAFPRCRPSPLLQLVCSNRVAGATGAEKPHKRVGPAPCPRPNHFLAACGRAVGTTSERAAATLRPLRSLSGTPISAPVPLLPHARPPPLVFCVSLTSSSSPSLHPHSCRLPPGMFSSRLQGARPRTSPQCPGEPTPARPERATGARRRCRRGALAVGAEDPCRATAPR